MTRHADAALTVLTDLASDRYPALREAAVTFSVAHNRLMGATDLVDGLRVCVSLTLALEDLRDRAKEMVDSFRNKMAEVMEDTGAGRIDTDNHVAGYSRKVGTVTVTNEAALPAEYWTQSKPTPDKSKIATALKARQLVPGAMLMGNGSPALTIRPKDKK